MLLHVAIKNIVKLGLSSSLSSSFGCFVVCGTCSLGCLDASGQVFPVIEALRVEACTGKRAQSVTTLGGALPAFEVLT